MTDTVQARSLHLQVPDYEEAWQMVLGQLRAEMPRQNFETWVQPLMPMGYRGGVFTVGAANPYGREWVESRLTGRVSRLLEGLYGESVHFAVVVNNGFYAGSGNLPSAITSDSTPEPARPEMPRPPTEPAAKTREEPPASPRKVMLARAYGSERARVIQPERGMFLTLYFFEKWLPLIGHSAFAAILAARSLCYWNPKTGELRNVIETDMAELAARASVSVRTMKDVLNDELVKRHFLRYRVRRIMTPNGVRTAGILLQVRMDDPLTPEDQDLLGQPEADHWFSPDFEDEEEEG